MIVVVDRALLILVFVDVGDLICDFSVFQMVQHLVGLLLEEDSLDVGSCRFVMLTVALQHA